MKTRLLVKTLHPDAIVPTCAHPGEDLAFDLYALEDTWLFSMADRMQLNMFPCLSPPVKVRTGISAKFEGFYNSQYGLLIRDRSSVASQGVFITGGVVDAGYTGEILVMMTNCGKGFTISKGTKIAQMIPIEVLTGSVEQVKELPTGLRGEDGFGSTGVF